MSFLSQFSSFFTAEERESELFKMWSQIGVNMEKAYLETQGQLNAEMTDINAFSEDTCRSWLSFFMKKIPNRITSKVQATIKAGESFEGTVTLNRGATLKSKSGKPWVLMEDLTMNENSERVVTLVQGKLVTAEGNFSTLIKIQANNPDLDYLKLYSVSGTGTTEIEEVSFTTSYDNLKYKGSWTPDCLWAQSKGDVTTFPPNPVSGDVYKYVGTTGTYINGHLYQWLNNSWQDLEGNIFGGNPKLIDGTNEFLTGDMFNVIHPGRAKFSEKENAEYYEFGMGDMVVFDGEKWTPISSMTGLNPFQFQNQYGVPAGGYYDNTPSNGYFAYYQDGFIYIKVFPGSRLKDLTDTTYKVEYIESDGIQGEISATDTITFDGKFPTTKQKMVEMLAEHDTESTKAVNSPSTGKLSLFLKERFFSGINISSVPEYTIWFKAQPEVGDCFVLSDYEKFIRSGKSFSEGFDVTGVVEVMAVDRYGNAINDTVWGKLLARIEEYKDIAFIDYKDFTRVMNYFKVTFTSSLNNTEFKTYVRNAIEQWYDVDFLQVHNCSLFANLNMSEVLNDILNNDSNETQGVNIEAFHCVTREDIIPDNDISITEVLKGEKIGGGFYRVYNGDTLIETFYERLDVKGTSANIYRENSGNLASPIGSRNSETGIVIRIPSEWSSITTPLTLKCYLPSSDPAYLYVGEDYGMRSLEGVEVYMGETLL